jgi:hypothetical protein
MSELGIDTRYREIVRLAVLDDSSSRQLPIRTSTDHAAVHHSIWDRARKLVVLFFLFTSGLHAADNWPDALRAMPLNERVTEINEINFAPLFLGSFQSNHVVKALILMPATTDEFYFFHRANTKLGPADNNLLAALSALTNQTRIRAHFRPPFLLLYSPDDSLTAKIKIKSEASAAVLRATPYLPHASYNDRDWNYLRPILSQQLDTSFWPPLNTRDSWHFYRHSFAGWNLNGLETIEAIALAGKSTVTIEKTFFKGRPKVSFYPDQTPAGK